MGLKDGLEVGRRPVGSPPEERGGVASLEEVDSLVVGEEDLAGVKPAAEGKVRPPAAPE